MRTSRTLLVLVLLLGACGAEDLPKPKGSPLRDIAKLPSSSATNEVVPTTSQGRLPAGARPTAYLLRFDFTKKDSFVGEARVSLRIPDASRFIVMHAKGLTFESIAVTQGSKTVSGHVVRNDDTQGDVTLRFDEPLVQGEGSLAITYRAPFGADLEGIYRANDGATSAVFSQFEPTNARRAFPCFDEPAIKTPYEVEILVPAGEVAFANGKEISRTPQKDGSILFRFDKTLPLPSYLVAVAAGPLGVLEGSPGTPAIRTIALAGKEKAGAFANAEAAWIIREAARYTNVPYPYGKLDLVAVPDFNAGAMENPGLVTFREERLIPSEASARSNYGTDSIVAHELAHQWFGDLVTAKWWDEIWLNEAFATWFSSKLLEGAGTQGSARNLNPLRDARITAQWVMDEDGSPASHPIRTPVRSASEAMEAFDGITYDKGAAVLRMLESDAGSREFADGIHAYLTNHAHGAAGWDDLWNALAPKSKGTLRKGRFQALLDRPGVASIDVTTQCESGHPKVSLEQAMWKPLGSTGPGGSELPFDLPVCFTQGSRVACIDMTEAKSTHALTTLSCDKPFFPNASLEGYYRFTVTPPFLLEGARAAEAEVRIGALMNTWAGVRSGKYDVATLVRVLSLFSKEQEPQVLTTLARVLAKVGDALVTESSRTAYADFVTRVLAPAAQRFTWTPPFRDMNAHEEQAVREVTTTLFDHGNPPIALKRSISEITKRTLDHKDRDRSVPGPEMRELAVELSARDGGEAYWNAVMNRLRETRSPRERVSLVRALASFDDEVLLGRSLSLALDGSIKLQDLRYLVQTSVTRPKSRELALAWYDMHWDPWRARLPTYQAARAIAIVPSTCGSKFKAPLFAKFEASLPEFQGWKRTYQASVASANACEALRSHTGTTFGPALRSGR